MMLLATVIAVAVIADGSGGDVRVAIEVDREAVRGADTWSEPNGGERIIAMVTASEAAAMRMHGVAVRVVDDDVDRTAREERSRLAHRAGADWYADYRDVDEVGARM